MANVQLYDTTLRDGAQQEGISLSVEDKLRIVKKLDELGIHFIEGGWPGSNPKDAQFFAEVRHLPLKNATIAAFGSTRRAGLPAERDPNLKALLESGAPVATLVGKSWDLHVSRVLETSLEENLAMIYDSVAYLKGKGLRLFFDAEHFFDGYQANPSYALETLRAAARAGAEVLALCDTNGGTLPNRIAQVVSEVRRSLDTPLGIHVHNDCDAAVAGSLAAISEGAVQVQGTINGYGERCGNANLISIIANLQLKMGIPCIPEEHLALLTEVSRFVSETVNMPPLDTQPYVGVSAFSHKGGLHASAVAKLEESYQHVPPEKVGNVKRVLVSELGGRASILFKLQELGLADQVTPQQVASLLETVKLKESQGFQYEGAEASFELMVRRALRRHTEHFALEDFRILVEKRPDLPTAQGQEPLCEATIKVTVGGETMHTAAEGNGPVNALDNALRKALIRFYPRLSQVRLTDYKVRVVDQGSGTGAIVRVLIESTDGTQFWRTVGSSTNIIHASWMALADSLEHWLSRNP